MKSTVQKVKLIILCAFVVIGWSCSSVAQTKPTTAKGLDQTTSFKVFGVCGQCKERIESTALDVKGVKKAEWDRRTDILVLVGSAKLDKQKVANALAKAGHKSELAAADPKGYANLPGCCQYDSGAEKH